MIYVVLLGHAKRHLTLHVYWQYCMHGVLKLAMHLIFFIIDNDSAIEQVLVTVKHEYINLINRCERETSIYETT